MSFRVTLPAVGWFLETKVDVALKWPNLPESRDTVHSIRIDHAPANFKSRNEARIRLLTHAEIHRRDLADRKIKVLFGQVPEEHIQTVYAHYAERLQEVDELIQILKDPKTLYNLN